MKLSPSFKLLFFVCLFCFLSFPLHLWLSQVSEHFKEGSNMITSSGQQTDQTKQVSEYPPSLLLFCAFFLIPKGFLLNRPDKYFFSSRLGKVLKAITGRNLIYIWWEYYHIPLPPLKCDMIEERDYYPNIASNLHNTWNTTATKQMSTELMKFQGKLWLSLISALWCKVMLS